MTDHSAKLGQHTKITVGELTRLLDVVMAVAEESGCTASHAIERIERLITADALETVEDRRAAIADFVGSLRRLRMRRKDLVGADLFRDPAWDMLLELYAANERGERLSVSSLCLASGSPQTTALRHVQRLEKHRLITRESDPDDERREFLIPTQQAIQGIETAAELLIQQTKFVDPSASSKSKR